MRAVRNVPSARKVRWAGGGAWEEGGPREGCSGGSAGYCPRVPAAVVLARLGLPSSAGRGGYSPPPPQGVPATFTATTADPAGTTT